MKFLSYFFAAEPVTKMERFKHQELPQGRSGIITREDIDATRWRIIHGISRTHPAGTALPMAGWRW